MTPELLKELEAKAYVMNGGSFDARGWTRCFAQVVAEDCAKICDTKAQWDGTTYQEGAADCASKIGDYIRAKYGIK